MRTCPSCGAANTEEARFCAACGASLAPGCPRCGADVPADARFCPSCGVTLADRALLPSQERRIVTVLFADVTGSTALGEQLDPEQLREVLDLFFAAMREEIEAEGGTVEKFIGDAVMAAFGVPTAHEDDPMRAVHAAVRMLGRLESVNADLDERHGVTLQMRIGANTGEVLATTDPQPGEAMVTGDTVNAAARLQAAAEPGTIVIGERTARGVRGFRLEDLGPLELKGKAQPARAFRVADELALAPERGVPGLRAPLVGRDTELELLRSIYTRAVVDGRPNLVTVYGDAGVGKSRLTQEFLTWSEMRRPDARTLRGRCLPYGDGITYWPLAEILKSTASVLDTDPPELALEKIAKAADEVLTGEVTSDPARTTAALAYTVGVEDQRFGFGEMDPKDVRAELHAAWRSFFSALGASAPTLVVVEDIHWADGALLDLLGELAEGVTGSVVFLCPSRPELTARRPGWGGGRRNFSSIALDPLSLGESEHLVRALLAIDDLPDTVRSRILERGEGNPFFLEEILRHLIDGRNIVHVEGRWRATDAVAEVEIPDTVQAVLAARIDLLEPVAKRLLQGAAVVGREFWPDPARMFGDVGADDCEAALRVLLERDLIVSRLSSRISGEPEFSFKHVLTRDVAYESLPHRERPRAHARVGAWIEETAGDRVREFNELLAHHFGTAARAAPAAGSSDAESERLRTKAFGYLLDASTDARRREVLKKAQRLAEEAIAFAAGPLERSLALDTMGRAYYADYDGDPAWRCFLEAARLRAGALQPPDAEVARLCGRACDMPTRWPGAMRIRPDEDEVRECLELGISYLPEGDSEVRIGLQMIRATWPFAYPARDYSDDYLEGCEGAGIEAYKVAMRLGLPNLASAALDAAQSVPSSLGNYARSVEYSRMREPLLPDLTDLSEIGDLTACAAWADYEVGDYRGSDRWGSEGIRLMEGRAVAFRLHSQAWRCAARYRLGDWDGAMQDFHEIRTSLDERRDDPPYFTAHAYGLALMIDHARGGTIEIQQLAPRLVVAALSGTRFTRMRPWMAMFSVAAGDLVEAHRLIDELPAGWRVHGGDALEARCELAAADGDWSLSSPVTAEAREFATANGLPVLRLFADRLDGLTRLETHDAVGAEALLRGARDGFAAHGAAFEQARTNVALARCLRALGRNDEIQPIVREALETFELLGAINEIARSRDFLPEPP